MAQYIDSHKTDKITERPDGSIIVPARLTRVGVFEYEDGGQLRPEDEVFNEQSLASINDIPITIEHPNEAEVTPKNYKAEVVGHVINGSVKRNGRYIEADLLISDKEAIDLVKKRKMLELSMGYVAEDDATSGIFEDEEYSSIQRNIQYNHLSIVPEGRAGPMCRMIVDKKDSKSSAEQINKDLTKEKTMIKIDGKEYQEGSAEHLAVLSAKLDAAEKALKEAGSAKVIAEKVKARIKLLDSVKRILKDEAEIEEEVIEDMDEAEIKKAAIVAKFPELKEVIGEKSEDFVEGMFSALNMLSEKAPAAEAEDAAVYENEENIERDPKEDEVTEEVMEEEASVKTDRAVALRGFKAVNKTALKVDTTINPIQKFQIEMAQAHKNLGGIKKGK